MTKIILLIYLIIIFWINLVCASNNAYQENDRTMCSEWFDYTNGCYDDTCNGIARMSLTSEAVSWMNSNGYSSNATAAKFCTISAPWPLSRTTPLLQVKLVCQQICDYCLPSTTTSTSTSTTTETNRRKIIGNFSFKSVIFLMCTLPLKLCLPSLFQFSFQFVQTAIIKLM